MQPGFFLKHDRVQMLQSQQNLDKLNCDLFIYRAPMTSTYFRFLFAAMAFALTGCAELMNQRLNGTNHSTGVLKTTPLNELGFVAGRIRQSCDRPDRELLKTCAAPGWGLELADANGKDAGEIGWGQLLDKAESARRFTEGNASGRYFCFPIAPGQYKVQSFGIDMGTVGMSLTRNSVMRVPLLVEAERITYIGEIDYNIRMDGWQSPFDRFEQSWLTLSDKQSKWLPEALRFCPPQIANWPVSKAPLDANANGGHPMLRQGE